MKRLTTVVTIGALAAAPLALAKGPERATISGPGLEEPIVFRESGTDEGGGGTMGRLSWEGGFFVEAFGELPDPRLAKKPLNLGPRYRVDYRMSSTETVHQDLYPYAAGGLVTHMESGQRFWNEQRTKGGWFRAPELAEGQQTLTAALISAGLPDTETTDSSTTKRDTLAAVFAAAVAVVAAVRMLRCRRVRPPPKSD